MINDYPTLQSTVAQWLARADLAGVIPTCIQLAEARINADLSLSPQQEQTTGTSAGGIITPPADFRQVEGLFITVGQIEMVLHPGTPSTAANASIQVIPDCFYQIGNAIYLNCNTDYAYRMVYYAGIPSLSSSAPTNWLILRNPNVYLYATLLELAPYLQDDDRINVWGAGYKNAVASLQAQDDHIRFGPSPRSRVDFSVA